MVIWLPERGKDGLGVLKVWNPEADHVILKSWNPKVKPIVIDKAEPFEVQGVVVDVRYSPRQLKRIVHEL
ncbi:hypothetical protein Mterra_00249 [Calidithermus terrae]|uniref:Uncharacterized protein n=1 Tax=Calidithermus terrae TaxID=1408545 RepID=A0A399F1I7_9DEIN|nr:hypothetical protein [Calidithermus terrae]RIH90647.1 hypothetical protein Mterra_00249 [Calidithermus terrae]